MKMLARQRVEDYTKWKAVFDSHAEAQKEAGLSVVRVYRNVDNPQDVVAWFDVEDEAKARAFVSSPDVPAAKERSGVVGDTEILFLE